MVTTVLGIMRVLGITVEEEGETFCGVTGLRMSFVADGVLVSTLLKILFSFNVFFPNFFSGTGIPCSPDPSSSESRGVSGVVFSLGSSLISSCLMNSTISSLLRLLFFKSATSFSRTGTISFAPYSFSSESKLKLTPGTLPGQDFPRSSS